MASTVLPSDPVTQPPAKSPRSTTRLIVKVVFVALLVMFIAECLRIFVGSNFHTVVPGKCYRSAQPTAAFLDNVKRTYGVCTVVNLRDENLEQAWYHEEVEATGRLGITLSNAGLTSKEHPPADDFLRFVTAIRDAKEPVLIHCANGNDRSGLASAVYLLLRTDTPIQEARGQLGIRYGHLSWTKASCLMRILDSYESWLAETGKTHHADHFYFWSKHKFQPETPSF